MFVGLLALEQADRIDGFAIGLVVDRGRFKDPPGPQVGGGLSRFPKDRQARFLPPHFVFFDYALSAGRSG
jgi:hypothetical protein